ncbi:MAG: enoyl-CoA hydratase/isomerase family protein [Deltaproteobacteria bacterium]|nr:enoyl-CoA hydratase/isomerase family protein [Deltaproteobacteria bacterium]
MPNLIELTRPRDGVALVTVNLQSSAGFVSFEAIDQLAARLAEAREAGARIAVLASALPDHWYEHAWLPDLCDMLEGRPVTGDPTGWFRALDELSRTTVVTIAAVSGPCSGGGAELGWACDLRIAEERATFSQPEVMIGVPTGVGGTSRLARLIGRTIAAEMVLDGAPLSARRIHELGGVNRVVPNGSAVTVALEWASRLASRPPQALAAIKQVLIDSDELHLRAALESEQRIFQETAATPAALSGMKATQARFDAGESIRDVYGAPRG